MENLEEERRKKKEQKGGRKSGNFGSGDRFAVLSP